MVSIRGQEGVQRERACSVDEPAAWQVPPRCLLQSPFPQQPFHPQPDRRDYLTAGRATRLEGGRSARASLSWAGISLNEIFGSSGQRDWILMSQKNNRMRQQIFQPPSNSPASSAVTADGRLSLSRGSK